MLQGMVQEIMRTQPPFEIILYDRDNSIYGFLSERILILGKRFFFLFISTSIGVAENIFSKSVFDLDHKWVRMALSKCSPFGVNMNFGGTKGNHTVPCLLFHFSLFSSNIFLAVSSSFSQSQDDVLTLLNHGTLSRLLKICYFWSPGSNSKKIHL